MRTGMLFMFPPAVQLVAQASKDQIPVIDNVLDDGFVR
jgi:hypothetical protein